MSYAIDSLARTLDNLVAEFYNGNIKVVVTDDSYGKKTYGIVANDTTR